ncbi:MAG: hypothetical protein ACRESA_03310 [Gammaproteobacteria bacterium]
MNRRAWTFGLLSLIAIAACIQLIFLRTNAGLPFNVSLRDSSRYVIAPIRDIALPPGIKAGDELLIRQMTPAARAAALLLITVKPGLVYNMVVRRGNQILTVPVTSRVISLNPTYRLDRILSYLLFFSFLVLGLLALWRGRDAAAWGLGLMSLLVVVNSGLRSLPVSATAGIAVDIVCNVVIVPLIAVGLYMMTQAVVGTGLGRRVKWLFAAAFILVVLLLQVLSLIQVVAQIYFAAAGWSKLILPVISLCTGLIPFVMLVAGYARAGAEQRLRIRWILASTGIILLALVFYAGEFLTSSSVSQRWLDELQALAFLLAAVGYGYAVLRHRLVDVRIVLNRTLVYGAITAVVVGVFAAINAVVERETLGQGASLMLELIVPLALGIVLGSLRKYLDTYINRLVFRRQYHAERALNDFARTCGFIEQPDHLLDLTVQQVFEHSHAESVALYERQALGYARVRQRGTAEFPQQIGADDLAFVRLRAGDHEADLHEVASALGKDGYVFSMAVRGKLIGALVCGPRPAEQYTADERAPLFHVAQQAGAALHALRSREHEYFVDSVARGALDATSARERARQLVAAWQIA